MATEKAAPKARTVKAPKDEHVIEKCLICSRNMLDGRCAHCGFEKGGN